MTVQSKIDSPINAAKRSRVASVAADDSLLGCLEAIARHHDRSIAGDVLVAGLPLEEGRLTPSLFVRAAARAGYSARVLKRSLKKFNPLVLPAVLLMNDGSACVLENIDKAGNVKLYLPDAGGISETNLDELNELYSGHCILVKPEYRLDQRTGEMEKRQNRHWFWGVVFQLWPTYSQVIFSAAMINLLALAAPLFIMNVYDRVLPNKAIPTLWVLAIGIGAAILFDFLLKMLRGVLIDSAGRRADVLLSSRIFEQILNMQLHYRPTTTGAFASHLKEFETVREFFTSSTVATLTDLMFLGLFLFVIHLISGPLVWVPVVAVILVLLVGLVIQIPLHRSVKETQRESSHRHSLLVEVISSLETIKSVRAEAHMQRLWERFAGRTARTTEKVKFYSAIGINFTGLVQQLVTVGIVVGGVYMFKDGNITMGAIIATVILSGRAVAPLGQIAMTIARCQQSATALKALNEIMSIPVESSSEHNHIARRVEHGKIEFKAVTFSYPGAEIPALKDFSLTIQAGERVGIIGRIGSGKTTIGRLINRLYVADEGALLVDDVDIRQYHPDEIRRAVAFVVQEADLLFGSVRDNIVIGSPYVDDEAVIRAARLSGVEAFVKQHPKGFDMQVGERGQFLSGGQRQAVALARALLFQPPVLYLDEPSSAMDLATEQAMIRQLQSAIVDGQTVIISTHRNSMLTLVDRLVVIDAGKVVADGPKEKVLEAMMSKHRAGKAGKAAE